MKLPRFGELTQSAAWMLLGQGLGYGLRVVYFIVIARLLGVMQYGVIVGAFALVTLVAEYGRLGTGTLLLRYVSADHKKIAAYWGNVLVVTLTMSTLLILILRLIAPHVLDAASAAVIVMTAVASCLCEQLTISATQCFQALQQMRLAALLNQLTSLLRCIAAVMMLVLLHHASARQWALASMVASAVAMLISLSIVTVRLGLPTFSPQLALTHGTEGIEFAFASSTSSAYNDLDKTMLSHYGMSEANGVYGMAYRILEMAAIPIASLQLAASPKLFQLASAGPGEPIALGRKLLKHGLGVSCVTAIGMFVCAPLIPVFAGHGFDQGVEAVRWLCLIPVFRALHGITGSVLTSIGRQRARTLTQLTAVAVNFGLNLWLIPSHGWRGAAWASLATDSLLAFLNWSVLERERIRLSSRPEMPPANLHAIPYETPLGSRPLVSVIIPYYNHPTYVVEAVSSVQRQSYGNVEIIVVDDGSSLPAQPALMAFPGVTLIRTGNRGVSAARNLGFLRSSGSYLIFLDADDRLTAEAIESHLHVLNENPEAGLSFGSCRLIDENGKTVRPAHICRPRGDYFRMLLETNPIGCPGGAMIRREAFIEARGFDESFRNADDYELYLRLVRLRPFVQHNDCVVDYRKHSGGKSLQREKMVAAVMRALDQVENDGLTKTELRQLRHGRKRWLHTFQPQTSWVYQLESLYYSFRAMQTVPIRHYFRARL